MRPFILLGLAVLAACQSEEKNAAAGTDAAANAMAGDATRAASNAAAEREAVDAAVQNVQMPAFAPQYPGSTIKNATASRSGGREIHTVTLATTDNAAKIVDFYRERFNSAGMKKAAEFISGGTGMMSAAGNGRKGSIAISKEADHTAVIVTYSGDAS